MAGVQLLIKLCKEYWLVLSISLLVFITFLSMMPLAQLPSVSGSDKTHHFIAYGVLALPLMLKKPKYWLAILVFFVLWSGGIELVQPYANRYGEWIDLAANIGGIITGSIVAFCINRLFSLTNVIKTVSTIS